MGIGDNPIAMMMRKFGADAEGGAPVEQAQPPPDPAAPQGLNFQPDTDVLGPRLNPVKGLMQKLGFALGDAVRKQFGMPTDEQLAQQDFENRLKVKQYKMQEQAAVSQEELRKQEIADKRQEHQMINVPGYGNVQMKDMPEVMHSLATEKQAQSNLERQYAHDKEMNDNADQRHRDYLQHETRMGNQFVAALQARADRGERTSYQPITDAQGNITGFFDIHNPTNRISATDIGRRSAASPEQQKISANASSGLKAIRELREMIKNDKSLLVKGALPGKFGARSFNTKRNEVTDVITRLRTGAALNKDEAEFYSGQLPGLLDITEPGAIDTKLNMYEDLFTKMGGTVTATPTAPNKWEKYRVK